MLIVMTVICQTQKVKQTPNSNSSPPDSIQTGSFQLGYVLLRVEVLRESHCNGLVGYLCGVHTDFPRRGVQDVPSMSTGPRRTIKLTSFGPHKCSVQSAGMIRTYTANFFTAVVSWLEFFAFPLFGVHIREKCPRCSGG